MSCWTQSAAPAVHGAQSSYSLVSYQAAISGLGAYAARAATIGHEACCTMNPVSPAATSALTPRFVQTIARPLRVACITTTSVSGRVLSARFAETPTKATGAMSQGEMTAGVQA